MDRGIYNREPNTPGEIAFETCMRENGLRFRYEGQEHGKTRRPDYTIRFDGRDVKIDAKI